MQVLLAHLRYKHVATILNDVYMVSMSGCRIIKAIAGISHMYYDSIDIFSEGVGGGHMDPSKSVLLEAY